MFNETKESWQRLINRQIEKRGCHIMYVEGGPLPPFAYTIGLTGSHGFELAAAGLCLFSLDEVLDIIMRTAQSQLDRSAAIGQAVETKVGQFRLREVHASWQSDIGIGAVQWYEGATRILWLEPEPKLRSLDVPRLSEEYSVEANAPWKWMKSPWDEPFEPRSRAATTVGVLFGQAITHVIRWEEDQWELWPCRKGVVKGEEVRIAPVATLLALDPTLGLGLDIELRRGVSRHGKDSDWEWIRESHPE